MRRSKVSTHRVDDGGGARLLYRFTTGVWIQAAGMSTTTPHTAILVVSCMAAAAVRAAHRAVVQSHWGQNRRTRASGSVLLCSHWTVSWSLKKTLLDVCWEQQENNKIQTWYNLIYTLKQELWPHHIDQESCPHGRCPSSSHTPWHCIPPLEQNMCTGQTTMV